MESAPVVIADGHHRYETALTYQAECAQAGGDLVRGSDAVMAFVVELSDNELSVGPIHRTLRGVAPEVDLAERFGQWFDLVHVGPNEGRAAGGRRRRPRRQALALVTAEEVWLLTPREQTYAEAGSDLDSSLVALVTDTVGDAEVAYVASWADAVGAVNAGRADAALLLRPVTVDQISDWAHARQRMPPKSTFFRPKPRTGMVFRSLDS